MKVLKVSRFSVTKKNGESLTEQDIKTFYLRMSVVCMQLGFLCTDNKELPMKGTTTVEDLVVDDVGQVYNPNQCDVCDD